MTEWISCKDRLPIDGKRYPVLIEGEILRVGMRTVQEYWIDDQMGEIFPTHWAELPEPPNESPLLGEYSIEQRWIPGCNC